MLPLHFRRSGSDWSGNRMTDGNAAPASGGALLLTTPSRNGSNGAHVRQRRRKAHRLTPPVSDKLPFK